MTLDNELALHDIRIIKTVDRTFIAMPSRKDEFGVYHDIYHPISADIRGQLETAVIAAYYTHVDTAADSAPPL